jgi:hypothetical protein
VAGRKHSKSWGAGEVRLGSGLTGKAGSGGEVGVAGEVGGGTWPWRFDGDRVARVERDAHAGLADLGLRLAETKRLTAALQAKIVPAQVAAAGEQRRCCSSCGRRLASKGHYPVKFRSLFGDVPCVSAACLPVPVRKRLR